MAEIVSVPAIVVICYLIGIGLKAVGNETLDKFIPTLCGICGAILGLATFLTIPEVIVGNNWLSAVATGAVSGLAATGINQIYKQLKGN